MHSHRCMHNVWQLWWNVLHRWIKCADIPTKTNNKMCIIQQIDDIRCAKMFRWHLQKWLARASMQTTQRSWNLCTRSIFVCCCCRCCYAPFTYCKRAEAEKMPGSGKKGKDAPTHTDTHHAVDTMHAICKCARIILIPLGWKMCYSNLPSIFGSFAKVHQSAYRWCVQY